MLGCFSIKRDFLRPGPEEKKAQLQQMCAVEQEEVGEFAPESH